MAREQILVDNQKVVTLRELLRPGLRCVVIGLNPAVESVRCGHYYQGRLGRRLWTRLIAHKILPPLPSGLEDDDAFIIIEPVAKQVAALGDRLDRDF